MARKYFTLCIREDGVWSPQFGDYDRDVVATESADTYFMHRRRDQRIITTSDNQAAVNAGVAKLNQRSATQ